jgi:lipopolysaccharide export system permease protein
MHALRLARCPTIDYSFQMIFQRALKRELASSAGATFTVLFTVMVTWSLMSILRRAAGGKVDPSDMLALLLFAILNRLPLILALTSFIAVLFVVTRSYRDSEMVVWFASGQSLTRWIGPVLKFGLPIVVLTGLLSFYVGPWANLKSSEYVQRFEKREDLKKVAPGQFKESSSSDRVFFVEAVEGDSTVVQNVFVSIVDKNGDTVVVAKEGVIEPDGKGGQFLVLKNGRRYTGTPGQGDFRSMEFERYSMRMAAQAPVMSAEAPAKALPTAMLLELPNAVTRAELLARMAAPISCLLLILLAIPLAFVNPRAGASANLIIAVLVFFAYNNLIQASEKAVQRGKVDFALGWWPLHVLVGLCVLGLYAWRLNVNHPYHPLAVWSAHKRARFARTEV